MDNARLIRAHKMTRMKLSCCVFAATFGLLSIAGRSCPVFAQDIQAPQPKPKVIDANGMNMTTVDLQAVGMAISIGQNDNGLNRYPVGSNLTQQGNYSSVMEIDPASYYKYKPFYEGIMYEYDCGVTGCSTGDYIRTIPDTQSFSCTTPYNNVTSGTCSLILHDGTILIYDKSNVVTLKNYTLHNQVQFFCELSQIIKPDGEIISITYRTGGGLPSKTIRSVSSSLGWMLKYRTLNDDVNSHNFQSIQAINTSVDYCDPNADTCNNTSQPWPTVTEGYNGSNITVTDPASDNVVYGTTPAFQTREWNISSQSYTGVPRLTSKTMPSGVTTYYMNSTWVHPSGDGSGAAICDLAHDFCQPYTSSWDDVVTQIKLGSSTWVYKHGISGNLATSNTSTSPDNQITTYTYNVDDDGVSKIYFPSGKSVLYSYGDYGIPNSESKSFDSNSYSNTTFFENFYTEDDRANAVQIDQYRFITGVGMGPYLTTKFAYSSSCDSSNFRMCNKPTSVIDAKGYETDYTYDPAHGGVLAITKPADANGVRPQIRYYYSQLYPKIKDATGSLVNSTPVWRLIKTSSCRTATASNPASCVGSANETVTTYAYNSNNLLLTSETIAAGDGSVSATTSYTYDNVGNRIIVDGPRTDVDDRSYTTYDADRRPVFEIGVDPDGTGALKRQIVHHLYDTDGREYRTEIGSGNNTDGSDFVITRYTQRYYDSVTGLPVKTITAHP